MWDRQDSNLRRLAGVSETQSGGREPAAEIPSEARDPNGGPARIRTWGQGIMSPLLYR
jgi:hypothetical protein